MDTDKMQTINSINIGGVTFGFAPINVQAQNDFDVIGELIDEGSLIAGDLLGAQGGYELYSTLQELKGSGDGSISSMINTAISNSGHIKSVVSATVPTVATAQPDIIYLVEKADEEGDFDRYMLVKDLDENSYILKLSSTSVTPYTLPAATASTLGGVKVGENLTVDTDGTLSATDPDLSNYYDKSEVEALIPAETDLSNYYDKSEVEALIPAETDLSNYYDKSEVDALIPDEYSLPVASASTLGGIKVGANLTISADGTLNAQAGSSYRPKDVEVIMAGYEYSEEEKVVGCWTNGKPIYRKVINGIVPVSWTNSEVTFEALGLVDVDEVSNFSAMFSHKDNSRCYWSNGYMYREDITTNESCAVDVTNQVVAFRTGTLGASINGSCNMIFEYTKTTDAENSFTVSQLDGYREPEIVLPKWRTFTGNNADYVNKYMLLATFDYEPNIYSTEAMELDLYQLGGANTGGGYRSKVVAFTRHINSSPTPSKVGAYTVYGAGESKIFNVYTYVDSTSSSEKNTVYVYLKITQQYNTVMVKIEQDNGLTGNYQRFKNLQIYDQDPSRITASPIGTSSGHC